MNKESIVNLLQENICEVSFTKVNGETRVMPCTLREDILPKVEKVSSTPKKKNDSVLSVWVTDINQWRSFRVDNVTNIRVLTEENVNA